MSTKIYNGFRMRAISMKELHSFCEEIKERLMPKYQQACTKLMAKEATDMLDSICMIRARKDKEQMMDLLRTIFKDHMPFFHVLVEKEVTDGQIIDYFRSPLVTVFQMVCDIVYMKVEKFDTTPFPRISQADYDFVTKMNLFPPMNEKMMFTAYGERFTSCLRDLLCSKDKNDIAFVKKYELEEYHYQNQTDKPEQISDEEWEKRKNDWDNVSFEKSISVIVMPCKNIDTYILANVECEQVVSLITSKKYRVHIYAKDEVLSTYFESCISKDSTSPSEYMRARRKFMALVEQEEPNTILAVKATEERLDNVVLDIDKNTLLSVPLKNIVGDWFFK